MSTCENVAHVVSHTEGEQVLTKDLAGRTRPRGGLGRDETQNVAGAARICPLTRGPENGS